MQIAGVASPCATSRVISSVPEVPGVPSPCAPAPWPVVGRIDDPRLTENSGVAVSATHPGIAWVHNDSGDIARVFAVGLDGDVRAEVRLSRAITFDAEDIALAPGPDGSPWLWLADTGDNLKLRGGTRLFAFAEPDPAAGDQIVGVRQIDIAYPLGTRIDVEALLMDPVTGDGLLVSKQRDGAPARLLRLPREQLLVGSVRAELVGELTGLGAITAGDVRGDGGAIVLRSTSTAYEWRRAPGQSLAEALLATPPMSLPAPDRAEAIAFTPDGRNWISVPEGRPAPISRVPVPLGSPLRYDRVRDQ